MSNQLRTTKGPDHITVQKQFINRVRDPESTQIPKNVEQRRMTIYQELIYNNIENFIATAYPVLRQISSDNYWHKLIRDFIKAHKAHTPLFHKLPSEFLQYLEEERVMSEEDYPFLQELAHYEWTELAISVAEDEVNFNESDTKFDILSQTFVLSPLAKVFTYNYDVHHIGPEYLPMNKPNTPTFLLVYRDRKDKVHFMELNPMTTLLLEHIQGRPNKNAQQHLITIADEINHPVTDSIMKGGIEIIFDLYQRDVLLAQQ